MRGRIGGALTDFVVSKVAMSVCALIVAGGLTGAVESSLNPDDGEDLEELLAGLQGTVGRLAASGGCSVLCWTVPALPSGSAVLVAFGQDLVVAWAGGDSRAIEPQPSLHAWAWDGGPLNATAVEELDSAGPCVDAWTGDEVSFIVQEVLVDDSLTTMLFVR